MTSKRDQRLIAKEFATFGLAKGDRVRINDEHSDHHGRAATIRSAFAVQGSVVVVVMLDGYTHTTGHFADTLTKLEG